MAFIAKSTQRNWVCLGIFFIDLGGQTDDLIKLMDFNSFKNTYRLKADLGQGFWLLLPQKLTEKGKVDLKSYVTISS